MPAVRDNGGPVLASPQIVTVSWLGDPSHAAWEAFDDAVGSSAYWSTVTSEYGVGTAVSGSSNHVELSIPEPTWSNADVADFVQMQASDVATSGWPAPGANVVYAIFLPPQTASTFTVQGIGNACGASPTISGYHDDLQIAGVGDVAYAVIVPCPGWTVDEVTAFASHELVEAATDPHPSDMPAYLGIDETRYFAWGALQVRGGTEVADMCVGYPESFYTDAALGFGVQRSWSNASARAGHAPCVPAVRGPYTNVVPLDVEAITIDGRALLGEAHVPARGYYVPVGKSKTFAIGFYSDGPTSGPWTIEAVDLGDPYAGTVLTPIGMSKATVSLDVSRGQNGNIAYVTVTLDGTDQTKSDVILIESDVVGVGCGMIGSCQNYMPILLSADSP
jgi:hypothetical protein